MRRTARTGCIRSRWTRRHSDVNNGFDCVRVGTADATAQTLEVTYILSGAGYGGSSYNYCNPRAN